MIEAIGLTLASVALVVSVVFFGIKGDEYCDQ